MLQAELKAFGKEIVERRIEQFLVQIIKDENITKKVIDEYISLYPTKVYKNLYETGVVYAIA